MVVEQTTFTYGKGTITKAFKSMISYNANGISVAKKWVPQQLIKANTAVPVPAVHDISEGKDSYLLSYDRAFGRRSARRN